MNVIHLRFWGKMIVVFLRQKQVGFKVFWSSGRPLLCFSRFWPSENVARKRRVYFAYSRTKSVHTQNIASNAKGECVFFCFDCAKWSHYFIHPRALAARTKCHDVSTNHGISKKERFSKNGNIKNLVQMGPY